MVTPIDIYYIQEVENRLKLDFFIILDISSLTLHNDEGRADKQTVTAYRVISKVMREDRIFCICQNTAHCTLPDPSEADSIFTVPPVGQQKQPD